MGKEGCELMCSPHSQAPTVALRFTGKYSVARRDMGSEGKGGVSDVAAATAEKYRFHLRKGTSHPHTSGTFT